MHRSDGPALEYPDGAKSWWLKDQLHRMYGPAIEDSNGKKEWYLNGERLTAEEHFEIVFAQASEKKKMWMLFNLDFWK